MKNTDRERWWWWGYGKTQEMEILQHERSALIQGAVEYVPALLAWPVKTVSLGY